MGQSAVRLQEFWRTAKSVLRLTPLRTAGGNRNVVHVLSAHEARQWRLPVIFVCGLVERQFPQFHRQDPFFTESARSQLQRAGIRVRTTADFEAEERFLFDMAVTRASASLTLSYPLATPEGSRTCRRSTWRTSGRIGRRRSRLCLVRRGGPAAPPGADRQP